MSALFPNPRPKTYAAQSGFVYEIVYEGMREEGTYMFRVVSGPQIEMLMEVGLTSALLAGWTDRNRDLNDIEKFGVAKMALLRALDAITEPGTGTVEVQPESWDVAEICKQLDYVE